LRKVEKRSKEKSKEVAEKVRDYNLRKDCDEELHVVQTPRFIRTPEAPEADRLPMRVIVSCSNLPSKEKSQRVDRRHGTVFL